jgi:hypothetical protein
MIQEFRFNEYCKRLQNYVSQKLNDEFKLFMRWRGLNIDSSLFDIKFNNPQNFASYRQAEVDTARVSVFQTMEQLPYISKRFAMERFLGLTKEEIEENQKLWFEERESPSDSDTKGSDLRSIGISAGDLETDAETADSFENQSDEGGMPPEIGPAVAGPEAMPSGGGGIPAPPAPV